MVFKEFRNRLGVFGEKGATSNVAGLSTKSARHTEVIDKILNVSKATPCERADRPVFGGINGKLARACRHVCSATFALLNRQFFCKGYGL